MPRFNIHIGRFPYLGQESPDVGDWLVKTTLKLKNDPRIGQISHTEIADTPITMTRNLTVEAAKSEKADFMLLVDSDMKPDSELGADPNAKPFWDSSWEFMLAHRHAPAIIAAPYVGPPPFENIYVFKWTNKGNNPIIADYSLDQYTRDEACILGGFHEAGALPTGLILIDMRVFDLLENPYFYYEYTDKTESKKSSTEDVTFTRDACLAGAKLYCNWDAWAGHHKRYTCGKPIRQTADKIRAQLRHALLLGHTSNERVMEIGVGEPPRPEVRTGTRGELEALIAQENQRQAEAMQQSRAMQAQLLAADAAKA